MAVCNFWHAHSLPFKVARWNMRAEHDAIMVIDLQKRIVCICIALVLIENTAYV